MYEMPCHLLELVIVFMKHRVNAAIYQETSEHFVLQSAEKLCGDTDFILWWDFTPAHNYLK